MSTSTTTTYPFGLSRLAGLTYTAANKMNVGYVSVVMPTATATDMDPFSLKWYVDFDGWVGIFDGVTSNRIDMGDEGFFDFTVIAPQHRVSWSTTTSTTSTSTSTTTSTTTSTSTSTTTFTTTVTQTTSTTTTV